MLLTTEHSSQVLICSRSKRARPKSSARGNQCASPVFPTWRINRACAWDAAQLRQIRQSWLRPEEEGKARPSLAPVEEMFRTRQLKLKLPFKYRIPA